jgi:hypothetical protein
MFAPMSNWIEPEIADASMTFEAYRGDDGTPTDTADAQQAWSRAARPALVQVARRYGSLTTADELAANVQALSGVRTREPASAWIDPVLDAVDVECLARAEPLLSAFCVGTDGRMGERYRQFVLSLDSAAAGDIDMHAAQQRLEAHRTYGAILPVDGGQPALPPQLAKVRAAAPKRSTTRTRSTTPKVAKPRKPKKPELPARGVCPTCFLQLPATGRCDNCDE